jgi:hypothetical protein
VDAEPIRGVIGGKMADHIHHHDEGGSGVNALAIVAILAVLVGVGLAIWFFVMRSGTLPGADRGDGVQVDVKVDSSALELPFRNVA